MISDSITSTQGNSGQTDKFMNIFDIDSDIVKGGESRARAMEKVAKYLESSLSNNVTVSVEYGVDEGVDFDGERVFRTDRDIVHEIEIRSLNASAIDWGVVQKVHVLTSLKGEGSYDDESIGGGKYLYRYKFTP